MAKNPSTVYFADTRAGADKNLFDKTSALLKKAGLPKLFKKGDLVAVKLHFGEYGNTSFLRPQFIRMAVDAIKDTGAAPFLTDTNTLYVGRRTNSADHLECALLNGFGYEVTGAPIVIADGLRGESKVRVEIKGKHLKEAIIARDIVSADGIVVMTHFKCHELTGFGGALKNVGMGCAAREGKLLQHSNTAPVVDQSGCTACGMCEEACPVSAITIKKAAVIDKRTCIGCGHCIAVCPEGTINVQWNEAVANIQEKMAEHVLGALMGKEKKSVFVNYLTQISPACDCYGHNDTPIVKDVGILASIDPVALDAASADMVNAEEGFKDSALTMNHAKGADKFRGVHPTIDWNHQLDHAEKLGIGTRHYKITEI
ncbi:MAG: DUF362 domain-containing protein [Deltaproteobacteria bacterium]|nr:DUF362 domain-containing protein [Deltaproteobacteria bacterium]